MSAQDQETSDQTDPPSTKTTKDKVGKTRWQRLRKQVDKLTGKKDPATRSAKHKAKHDAKQEVPVDPDPGRNPEKHESGNESAEENDEVSIGVSSEESKSCSSDGQRVFAVSESQEWIFAVQHSKQHPLYRKAAVPATGVTAVPATGVAAVPVTGVTADGQGATGGASEVPGGAHMVPGGASHMRHPMHRSGMTMVERAHSDASTGSVDTAPTKPSASGGGKSKAKDRAIKGSEAHGSTGRVQGSLVQMLADCCKVQTAVSGVEVQSVDDGGTQTEGERLAASLCSATLESTDNESATEKCALKDNVFETVQVGVEAAATTDVQIALNDVIVEIAPNGDVMEMTSTSDGDSLTKDCAKPTSDCAEPTSDSAPPTTDGATSTSDSAPPTSAGAKPISDGAKPISDCVEPTSDSAPPTTDGATSTSDSAPPTTAGAKPISDCAAPTIDCATATNDGATPTNVCTAPISGSATPTSDKLTSTSEEGIHCTHDGTVVHQTSYIASMEIALNGALVQPLGDGASKKERTVPVQSNDTTSASSESITKHSGPANNSIAFDTNSESVITVSDEKAANLASTGANETPTHNPPGILKKRIDSSIAFNTNPENVNKVSDERATHVDSIAARETPTHNPPGILKKRIDYAIRANNFTACNANAENVIKVNVERATNPASMDANETPTHNAPGIQEAKKCTDSAVPANNSIAFNTKSESVMKVRDEIASYFASMDASETPTQKPPGILKKRIESATQEDAATGTPGANEESRAAPHQCDDIDSTIASHKPTGHVDTCGDNSRASPLNNKWHSMQDLNHNDHRTPSKQSNAEPVNKPVPFYKIGSAGRWSHRDLSKKYTIKNLDSKPARHKTTALSDADHRTNSDMDLSQMKPTGRRFLHNVFIRNKAGPDEADGNKTSAATESKPEGRPRNTATAGVTRKKSFVQRFLHRKDMSRTAQQHRLLKQRTRDTEPKQTGDKTSRPVQGDNVPVDKESVGVTEGKHQRKGSTKDRPPPAGRYAITRMFSKWKSMSDIPSVNDGVISAKEASKATTETTATKGTQPIDAKITNTWWSQNDLTSTGVTRNSGISLGKVESRKGRRHSECVLPDHKALEASRANDAPCRVETPPRSDSTENIKQAQQSDSTWATEYSSSTRQGPSDNTDGGSPQSRKRVPKMSDAAPIEPNQNEYKKKKPNRLNRVFARRKTVSEIPTALIQQAVQITAAAETGKAKSPRKPSDHCATTPLGDDGFTGPELHPEAGTVYQAMQMSDDDKDTTETEYTFDDPPTYDHRKKKVSVIVEQPTQPVPQDRLDPQPKKCSGIVRRHSVVGIPPMAASKMSKKQLGTSAPADKVGNSFTSQ